MTNSDPEKDQQRFVILRQFRDLPEAMLAKGVLESDGIECFLNDQNIVWVDWFLSNAVGGVKLCVRQEDVKTANNLLNEARTESFDEGGAEEYLQPRCPNCQSTEVSLEELNKPLAYGSLLLGFPIPIKRRGWKCHSCGHVWKASDNEPSELT